MNPQATMTHTTALAANRQTQVPQGRLMGVHNALGGILAEEAGFDGLWVSGLEVSASMGVPDTEIVSLSQMLDLARSITRVVDVPVIVDADTGYGDPQNLRYAVAEYMASGVAGICIEDKVFPKRNSFIEEGQVLEDPDVFACKIAAAKEVSAGSTFSVVARVESIIAGRPLAEALHRARTYRDAGADAVLIHDKSSHGGEVLAFAAEWDHDLPLVAVPTTYHQVEYSALREAGYGTVIYANQGLRSAVSAMRTVMDEIGRTGSSSSIESSITPVAELFRLQSENRRSFRELYPAAG